MATRDRTEEFTIVTGNFFAGGANVTKRTKNNEGGGLADILGRQRARLRGAIASARVAFSVNPSNNDTLTIGGHLFTFKGSLGVAAATTQVKILGSASLTRAALVDAINGVTNTNVVAATTPFAKAVVADASITNYLRIRQASQQGGTAVAGAGANVALAASISGGASAWNVANLNAAGGRGMDGKQDMTIGTVVITAAMLTATMFHVELPFTPTEVLPRFFSTSDVEIVTDDAVSIDGDAIKITFNAGAKPLIAGDKVKFIAIA